MYIHFQVDNLMRQITVEIVSIYFTLQVFSRLFHYNLNLHSTTTLSIKVSQISLILNSKEVTLVLLLKCTACLDIPGEIAYRICPIRDLFEETGVLLVIQRGSMSLALMSLSYENLFQWRDRVHTCAGIIVMYPQNYVIGRHFDIMLTSLSRHCLFVQWW